MMNFSFSAAALCQWKKPGGFRGYLLDLQMRMSWLAAEGLLFVPVLVAPGSPDAPLLIPWPVAVGQAPAEGTMSPGVFAEFTQLHPAKGSTSGPASVMSKVVDLIKLVVVGLVVAVLLGWVLSLLSGK